MSIKEKIGLTIKQLREETGLTKERLANISDVDRNYISAIESGKRNLSVEILSKILNALNITLSDFFKKDVFNN